MIWSPPQVATAGARCAHTREGKRAVATSSDGLPPIVAHTTEYRCHQWRCGRVSSATLPEDALGQFGSQLTALIAYSTVVYRLPLQVVAPPPRRPLRQRSAPHSRAAARQGATAREVVRRPLRATSRRGQQGHPELADSVLRAPSAFVTFVHEVGVPHEQRGRARAANRRASGDIIFGAAERPGERAVKWAAHACTHVSATDTQRASIPDHHDRLRIVAVITSRRCYDGRARPWTVTIDYRTLPSSRRDHFRWIGSWTSVGVSYIRSDIYQFTITLCVH